MAANKVSGIRAALCFDTFTAHQARAHNNANILAMGAWVVTPQRAVGILREWLDTSFEYGGHVPRIMKLDRERKEQPTEWDDLLPLSSQYKLGVAISAQATVFPSVLFAGRIEEGFKSAAACGLNLIELSVCDPLNINRNVIKKLVAQYDLQITALATGQNFLHEGLSLAAIEPAVLNKTIKRIYSIIDLAQDLGAAVIFGGIRGRFSSTAPNENERYSFIEGIRESVRYAAKPLATILSLAMMFRHTFGRDDVADRIEGAVRAVLAKALRTGDIALPGEPVIGTRAMGDAVVAALQRASSGVL